MCMSSVYKVVGTVKMLPLCVLCCHHDNNKLDNHVKKGCQEM